jgi:hypothetical protein
LVLEHPAGEGARFSLGPDGWAWIAEQGALRVVDPATGVDRSRVEIGGRTVPRIVGQMGDRFYIRTPGRVLSVDAASGEMRAERQDQDITAIALDPRGRHLYTATRFGAVLGLRPRSLRPQWAWPKLGIEATAAVSSPEGDRLYVALSARAEASEGRTRIVTRDVQTGRILNEAPVPVPFVTLATDAAGTIYGLADGEGSGAIWAFSDGPDGLQPLWRQSLRSLGLRDSVEMRVAPRGGRLAVFDAGEEGRLYLLDAATGEIRGMWRPAPLDAAFATTGPLYLLRTDAIEIIQ